jgi:hypothetical protein
MDAGGGRTLRASMLPWMPLSPLDSVKSYGFTNVCVTSLSLTIHCCSHLLQHKMRKTKARRTTTSQRQQCDAARALFRNQISQLKKCQLSTSKHGFVPRVLLPEKTDFWFTNSTKKSSES